MSYSFGSLRSLKYLNVELTTRCSVRCPMCPRTVFPEFIDPKLDMPLDFISRLNISPYLEKLYLIGANGEPTQHPHFLEIIKELKRITSAQIYINTHGSFKPLKWWKQLSHLLSPSDHLVFSIDGLEDTNHIYRVNAKWSQIETAVKASVDKVNTTWKFIVFKHNEHQILQAMQVAKEWGVKYFSLKRSDRWREAYWPDDVEKDWMKHLRPSDAFVTESYQDVEGRYSIKKKFNSLFNVKLSEVDLEEFRKEWERNYAKA